MDKGAHTAAAAVSGEWEKAWLALLLCWVAGFADAFGYLALNEIFTAHMSGNSVTTAAAAAQANWTDAAEHGWPILFFAAGFFLGAVLETAGGRLRIRRRFTLALLLETALLAAFFFIGENAVRAANLATAAPATFYLLLALLSVAMGVQSASLSRVRGQSVQTTFVTGMLTQSAQNAGQLLFHAWDHFRGRVTERPGDDFKRMIFYGSLWLSFALGAVGGAFGEAHWRFSAMLAPLGILGVIILCDLVRPIHGQNRAF